MQHAPRGRNQIQVSLMGIRTHRTCWLILLVFAALLAASMSARAQEPPGPIHPPPNAAPQKPPTNLPESPAPQPGKPQQKPIRVRVTEITAPVTARDRDGELVLNLEQKDFHVFDNGAEQSIDHFVLGGDPLAIALLVETSSRVEAFLPAVRQSGIVFTQTVMGPTADAAVLTYDDTVEIRQSLTGDDDAIENAVHKLQMGTSGSKLYDGIARGVALLAGQIVVGARNTKSPARDRVAHRLRIQQQRREPKSARSMQCASRSRRTRRGERQVGPCSSLL